jgi:hypothetical protein
MDASDVIIPCSQGPVVTSNRVLARVTVVISDNHQDLFSDINHSSLRSITGLLAATKPLSHTQAQQLHLLGLSLYLAANQHEGMQINPTLDTLTEDYNNVPPVLFWLVLSGGRESNRMELSESLSDGKVKLNKVDLMVSGIAAG